MIFTFDESRRLHLTVDHESGCDTYSCTYSVCSNPVCTCGTLFLDLIPLGDTTAGKKHVVFDVLHRKAGSSEANKRSEWDQTFSEQLVARLDDHDFQLLDGLFMAGKHTLSDESPIEAIDYPFDYEGIEFSSDMVAYHDVFRYAREYGFDMAGSRWIGFDMYCLNISCRCTQVLMQAFPLEREEFDHEKSFLFYVDYKTKRWTWSDLEDNCPGSLEDVRVALTSAIPDFYRLLTHRHQRMRAIYARCYKNYRAASSTHAEIEGLLSDELKGPSGDALITVTKKTGRNDPCPCGSGKKYKKCCMP
jgi:hypothetical protein